MPRGRSAWHRDCENWQTPAPSSPRQHVLEGLPAFAGFRRFHLPWEERRPTSVQDRVPQTFPDSICALPVAPMGFGPSIPLSAVQAENSLCPGVLGHLPTHCTILALLRVKRYVTSTRLGKTFDTAYMPLLAWLVLPICSQRTLQGLYLGAVVWSAKGDVLLHPPWCRPKGTTQLTCGSLQKSL